MSEAMDGAVGTFIVYGYLLDSLSKKFPGTYLMAGLVKLVIGRMPKDIGGSGVSS
jgi:hypothetical protein